MIDLIIAFLFGLLVGCELQYRKMKNHSCRQDEMK